MGFGPTLFIDGQAFDALQVAEAAANLSLYAVVPGGAQRGVPLGGDLSPVLLPQVIRPESVADPTAIPLYTGLPAAAAYMPLPLHGAAATGVFYAFDPPAGLPAGHAPHMCGFHFVDAPAASGGAGVPICSAPDDGGGVAPAALPAAAVQEGGGGEYVAARGVLAVGGVIPASNSSDGDSGMVWSQTVTGGGGDEGDALLFPLHHLGACGADLLAGSSGHWYAEVDAASECLHLPAVAFDALMAWLPAVGCPAAAGASFDPRTPGASSGNLVGLVCHLPPALAAAVANGTTSLPTLTFALTPDAATPLYLPLADLVVPTALLTPGGGSSAPNVSAASWCIIRERVDTPRPDDGTPGVWAPLQHRVRLGSRALRHLHVALDLGAHRVGFRGGGATATAAASPPYANCRPPTTCTGGQALFTPTNTCVEPACAWYLFQELDAGTHTCALAPQYAVLGFAIVGALAVAEVWTWSRYDVHLDAAWAAATGGRRPARPRRRRSSSPDDAALAAAIAAAQHEDT